MAADQSSLPLLSTCFCAVSLESIHLRAYCFIYPIWFNLQSEQAEWVERPPSSTGHSQAMDASVPMSQPHISKTVPKFSAVSHCLQPNRNEINRNYTTPTHKKLLVIIQQKANQSWQAFGPALRNNQAFVRTECVGKSDVLNWGSDLIIQWQKLFFNRTFSLAGVIWVNNCIQRRCQNTIKQMTKGPLPNTP